MTDRG